MNGLNRGNLEHVRNTPLDVEALRVGARFSVISCGGGSNHCFIGLRRLGSRFVSQVRVGLLGALVGCGYRF